MITSPSRRLVAPSLLFIGCLFGIFDGLITHNYFFKESIEYILNSGYIFSLSIIIFLEYLYGVGAAFPGSLLILATMASTGGNPELAKKVFFIIALTSHLTLLLNFFIGKSLGGRSLDIPFAPSAKKRVIVVFFLYAHPLTASIRSIQQGALNVSFRAFYLELLFAGTIWNIFWGLIMYHVGAKQNAFDALLIGAFIYSIFWLRKAWLAMDA